MKLFSHVLFQTSFLIVSSGSAGAFVLKPTTTATTTTTTTASSLNVATDPTAASKSKDDKVLFVDASKTRESVSKYYGQELISSEDLKTNACCTAGSPPKYIQECINNIHPEVVARYYGCGLCLPQYPLEGCNILDLGSGSGRDVYIASQLVGPNGKVCIDCFVKDIIGFFFVLEEVLTLHHICINLSIGCWCRYDG
jgi:hypothetical protein